MYLVFTRMSNESYRRRLGSLLSCFCDVFQVLINSFGLLILRVVLMFVDSVTSTLPSSSISVSRCKSRRTVSVSRCTFRHFL